VTTSVLSITPDDFHRRYPSFAPFIGERYGKRLHDDGFRLLLVGESHYLPEAATLHLDADRWYASDVHALEREQDAWHRLHPNDEEKDWLAWIDTAGVVKSACKTNFVRPGHWIWKNAFEVVNEAGPRYDDPSAVAQDIAFLNFFVRPARTGESLKGHLTPLDRELANTIFARRIAELRPTHVAFLSRFAACTADPTFA